MAVRIVASNGTSVIIADGQAAAAVSPDGTFVVAPLGSLLSQSDWEDADGRVPDYVPPAVLRQIADLATQVNR